MVLLWEPFSYAPLIIETVQMWASFSFFLSRVCTEPTSKLMLSRQYVSSAVLLRKCGGFYLASINTQVFPNFLVLGSYIVALLNVSVTEVCIELWFCVIRTTGLCDLQRWTEFTKGVRAPSLWLPSKPALKFMKSSCHRSAWWLLGGAGTGRQKLCVDRTVYPCSWSNEHMEQTMVEEVLGRGILTVVKTVLEEHMHPCWCFACVSSWNFQRGP